MEETYTKYEIDNLIIVGGESSKKKYPGPTVNETLDAINKNLNDNSCNILCGGISIPSRSNESKNLIDKSFHGSEFFTTQVIYDSDNVININHFDGEIIIDIKSTNPTLKHKKELENKILDNLKKSYSEDYNYKLNINIVKPTIPQNANRLDNIKNIIAISSAKGGVGKSTLTANIACSLKKMGFKVGVLDADIYGPSMHIMFDLVGSKPLAVNVDGKSKMSPIESYGIKILSIGFFTNMDQAVVWRGPMASKALNQLIFDADWGELDFLLVDLPPGTGDIHLSIMQKISINGALIISTPQIVALADARKGVSMYQQENINIPVLGIVENMAYYQLPNDDTKHYIFGKDGAKNLAEDFKIPFLGEIPIIQQIRESADVGRPLSIDEDSATAVSYTHLTLPTSDLV